MRKVNFILGVLLLTLISCNKDKSETEIQLKEKVYTQQIYGETAARDIQKVVYIKDNRTGLCFGEIEPNSNSESITCVPCDSLKKVTVIEIN